MNKKRATALGTAIVLLVASMTFLRSTTVFAGTAASPAKGDIGTIPAATQIYRYDAANKCYVNDHKVPVSSATVERPILAIKTGCKAQKANGTYETGITLYQVRYDYDDNHYVRAKDWVFKKSGGTTTTTTTTRPATTTTTSPAVKGIGKFVVLRWVNTETVRAGADPKSASLGSLANAKQLELMQEATIKYNDYTYYFKVVFNGKAGYISTRYMDDVRPDGYFAVQPDYGKYANYIRVKCAGILNVRTSASLTSTTNILARRAEHGDVLALKSTEQTNGCWQVEWDGRIAYVSAGTSYTERIDPTAIPSGNTAAQNAAWAAVVNQKNQTVSVYQNKKLVRFFTCTTGGTSEDRFTPVGTYTHRQDMNGLPGKKSLFLSWHTSDPEKEIFGEEDLTVFDCVRVTGSVYFHRVPRQANNSYDYYKARLNAAGSHGCIRIPEVHSRWMYDNFPYGGVVVVQPF